METRAGPPQDEGEGECVLTLNLSLACRLALGDEVRGAARLVGPKIA